MKTEEMAEVADIITTVLKNTKPANGKDGKPSQAKYDIDSKVVDQCRKRSANLLGNFPLYEQVVV